MLNNCPVCGEQPILSTVEGYPMNYKYFCGTHVSVGDWFPNTEGAELDWDRRTTDEKRPDFYNPTNADRIRSMSDEELADFLVDLADDGNLRIRDWLRQTEEDIHETD